MVKGLRSRARARGLVGLQAWGLGFCFCVWGNYGVVVGCGMSSLLTSEAVRLSWLKLRRSDLIESLA